MTSLYGKSAWGKGFYSVGPSGTLAVTQANQTLAAAAGPVIGGTLVTPQANQTLVSTGRVIVSGSLSATQANQTLSAAGNVPVIGIGGSLHLTQADQALTAAGAVLGTIGTLNLVQANQTLAAAGGSVAAAGLSVVQANQTLSAQGALVVQAALAVTQADQTLAATAVASQPPISANLVLIQDDQILAADGLILGWGPTLPCSVSPWEDSELCPPSLWTPVSPPNWELPGVTGAWGVGAYGVEIYQPSSSSPWLPLDQPAAPPTWTLSVPPVSVDWEETEPCDGG